MLLDRLRACVPATLCKLCITVAGIWPTTFASAQTTAPGASAASAPATALTPEERAKREGDQVFRWIMIHSDKPRKPVAAKDDKPAAAVATRVKLPVRTPEAGAEMSASTVATTTAAGRSAPPPSTVTVPDAAPVAASDESASGKAASADAAAAIPLAAAHEPDTTELLTPLSQTEPKFPTSLLRTLRSGQVQVKFTVLPDGSVAQAAVVASSNARLNSSALEAVAQWRFAPVRKPQQGIVDLGFNKDE